MENRPPNNNPPSQTGIFPLWYPRIHGEYSLRAGWVGLNIGRALLGKTPCLGWPLGNLRRRPYMRTVGFGGP